MSYLFINLHLGKLISLLPHKIYINGSFVGIMKTPSVRIALPKCEYDVMLKHPIPLFSTQKHIVFNESTDSHIDYYSRERWWNLIFTFEFLIYIVQIFVTFPDLWDWSYNMLVNATFVAWIIYEWIIRKRYYRIEYHFTPTLTQQQPASNN